MQHEKNKILERIDLSILLDPEHEKWNDFYSDEDLPKDEIIELVKYRTSTRQAYCIGGFIGYHIVKNILWNRNIGSKFFHYTRFTSIPIFFFAIGYTTFNKPIKDLKEAGVHEYFEKRNRFLKQ